ncbi:YiiX/YebB-like N1pC/P60 family cysteine hydrolase [Agarivorans sp. 1_MG-2023]|uniref:YiiX/YebB-like N1pC/P60 family cysteine hydrolase n=1 Tax=Agarivorans sp. 1_MG-2023 TaxID=3062634 RepID=UPI0026E292AB|nr:YiiX/YebB-like N1pC/P60 family cysteine hydrolase [Agarivorans sp. 1_MG-2023]MDO6762590.1 YiiX/YebB-like N1pC/P60 family cysteine hydrolase [Agarivorans sp. 1_MG-2023]
MIWRAWNMLERQQLAKRLKTGDLVFFSGKGLSSDIIRYGTFSKWSHVGMVLQLDQYDFTTMWEAVPGTGEQCLYSQQLSNGVQVVALHERVKKHFGSISVRQLMGGELADVAIAELMSLLERLKGRHYEQSFWELARAGWQGPFGENQEDLSSLFCSELVAAAYQCMGLLGGDKPSNEYTPANFSEDQLTQLNNGFYLSQEVDLFSTD